MIKRNWSQPGFLHRAIGVSPPATHNVNIEVECAGGVEKKEAGPG